MEGIETIGLETRPAIQIERGRIWHFWHRLVLEVWHWRLKRWIPRLVWLGDEIDVGVTFKNIGALGGTDPPCDQDAAVWDAQDAFRRMGIGFDTGSGCDGRDWEWGLVAQGADQRSVPRQSDAAAPAPGAAAAEARRRQFQGRGLMSNLGDSCCSKSTAFAKQPIDVIKIYHLYLWV